MSPAPEIVVTGRGVVSSIGEGADAFFEALLDKKSGHRGRHRRVPRSSTPRSR